MTLVSFGGWNFPRRRVVDDRVGTRDGLTPELHLPASKLMELFVSAVVGCFRRHGSPNAVYSCAVAIVYV